MHKDNKSSIPQYIPLKRNSFMPERAAQLPQSENPEDKRFVISFQNYRDDLCEIKLLEKHKGRRALENLRTIGRCYDEVSLQQNNIHTRIVTNYGEYKILYYGLGPDVEIREHEIQSTARIFYYFVDKYFYIRAIKNSHFETDKHR